ncbi:Card1-like endonuclease domain-containing protein [Candidatus Magnetominusculus xianensis]|uniref:DUF1887 family protein n=1 Tax=Candidatus Magnetominusculus xianensis TaxID=1748249 RepID=A0ABR5SNI9_9BACT|nr:DUF1887 family CARF protein [Candidatus Magnetominusculus xianensis]KWT94950.1 hypothetical protein ASN18_0100 [Candidatus Magnetominusculus xianensis]MBF0405196.1 DUF1887 family protein [Nitrospirota bacterium]
MRHICVSLVSDQTIPNILGIYHFKPDELLFITTDVMEKRGKRDHIVNTLKRYGSAYDYSGSRSHHIIVKEDSVLDCKRNLDQWIDSDDRETSTFTVNLTCGTKIMLIAAYEYFKEYAARMIYIPIGKNEFITPFPKSEALKNTALDFRLNVQDYLAAYGIKIENEHKLSANCDEAQKRLELSKWIVKNYNEIKPLMNRLSEKLRKHRNDKEFPYETSYAPKCGQEKELFNKVGIKYENNKYSKNLSKSEIIYLTGGWLEEYCYNELIQFVGKDIDDVVLGVSCKKDDSKNEFDVMFTKDNALYTVECKSLDQDDDKKADALYKIAALQKNFGIKVESFFVSTSPHILYEDGSLKQHIAARAEQFSTKVITPSEVINFADLVAKKLKIIEE